MHLGMRCFRTAFQSKSLIQHTIILYAKKTPTEHSRRIKILNHHITEFMTQLQAKEFARILMINTFKIIILKCDLLMTKNLMKKYKN